MSNLTERSLLFRQISVKVWITGCLTANLGARLLVFSISKVYSSPVRIDNLTLNFSLLALLTIVNFDRIIFDLINNQLLTFCLN